MSSGILKNFLVFQNLKECSLSAIFNIADLLKCLSTDLSLLYRIISTGFLAKHEFRYDRKFRCSNGRRS